MNRSLISTFYLGAAVAASGALSVPPTLTTGVQAFAATPPATDWSTVSITGAPATLATVGAVDTAAQALTAAGVATQLGTQTGNSSNAIAQRSSNSNFIYTAATGNNATALMATLQNDSGSAINFVTVAYDHTRIGGGTEESMGHRVFYSLTGLANSWTLIPALSGIGTNQSLSTSVTLSSAWADTAKLYLLWVDDNGSGSDGPFTIDNFVLSDSSYSPPTVALTTPANGALATAPGSFSLTATASDNGSVTQVEFLRNGSVIHTDTSSPYSFSDSALVAGNYSYSARATDNLGATTTSAATAVNVFTDPNATALLFDGVNDYVTMGAATGTLGSAAFTVECWFKRTGAGAGNASTGTNGLAAAVPLVTKGRSEGDNSNVDCNYFLGIDNATGILCADFEATLSTPLNGTGAANNNYPVFGTTVITNNVWTHAAATWDGSGWKLFINGVQETTTSPNSLPAPAPIPRADSIQHFAIGSALNSSGTAVGFFQGVIDEARVWNIARSPSEIAAGKDAEISANPNLLARYGLNEATGLIANNSPGAAGAPVGTLANGPLWTDGVAFVPPSPPTVTLTAPTTAYTGMAPATVSFTATANDSDGSVAKVEFYQGTTKLGEDSSDPYTFDWTSVPAGTYSLTAKATDNVGITTTSLAVSITVSPNNNQPGVITLSSPADSATGIGSSTSLSLGLVDPEGDATTVTFYGRKTTPAVAGPDFTVGTLPDTQFYSEGGVTGNGRGPTFAAQTQWYLDNRNSVDLPNLAFISHMGDIVEHGDATPAEWLTADAAMKVIENPITSFRPYGIAYGVTPGNHDFGTGGGTGTTVGYNQYFGISRFLGRNYYGGGFSGNNLSSYQLFSASGLDFIAISLEYNTGAKSTYQAQLDWADALLKSYPNHRAIISTHWMLETGNPAAFSAQGANIYNDLKDNPNLFLMLGGHVHGEGRRTDTFEGRTVQTVLQDYQGRTNGGDGWLRYFIFSPANNTINAKTYRVSNPLNPAAGSFETDSDSQFTLDYPMQSAVTPWIPLGSVNVPANGTTADLNWTGLEKSSNYEWYASANDGINTASSAVRRFSTTAAAAPTVTLTAPVHGTAVALPATLELTATAADADGNVTRVDFFNGGVKLGEDTSDPYSFTWNSLITGTHTLSAVAVDDSNLATLSNSATVTITNPNNSAPSVAMTSPVEGGTFMANAAVVLTASASDTDGVVSKVEFFLGATKLGEDLTSPFTWNWVSGPVGNYAFSARATDNDGGVTTSVIVTASALPAAPFISSYAQNFDSMSTNSATPAGWQVFGAMGGGNSTWENGTGIPAGEVSGGTANNSLIVHSSLPTAPSTASSNTQGYNFAETASLTNRALGSSPTTGAGIALQLELTNTGTQSISQVNVAYDIRRFSAPATVNHLPGYHLFYSLDDGFSWNAIPALAPTVAGPTGVIVPNSIGVTSVPATAITLAAPWYVGGTLRFRWIDDNAAATSPDQLYGLDNVAVNASQFIPVIGAPPTVSLTAPATSSTYEFGIPIPLAATAVDTDGSISKIEFFRGATKLGEDTTDPYTYNWASAPVGSHSLTARATDNDGNVVSTNARVVTVVAGASGTLTRSPYLNSPGHNSIVVRWRSSASVIGRVRYGIAPDNLNLSTDETIARTDHEVKLTGLSPYTRYYYSVGSPTDALTPELTETTSFSPGAPVPTAADYTFRTSPTPGTAVNTRIWIIGDCGRGSQVQADGRNAYYTSNFSGGYTGTRVPDLNLQLGDNAYNSGTDSEYQTGYFNMYANIFRKMPQMSTLGNHDANNTTPSVDGNYSYPYFNMFTFPIAGEIGGVASGTEHYYSFDYGNIHFVCLDSNSSTRTVDNPATTGVNEDAPMAAWLRQDLASTTATWIIAFWHHPPYSKGSHDSDTEAAMVQMRTNFNPILETGGVDLVFNGHSHNYERSVLLDGFYARSDQSPGITSAMRKNAGNGSTAGITTVTNGKIRNAANGFTATNTTNTTIPADGAYIKPLTGPRDRFGAVYNTAGMSGLADTGNIDHSAMYISYNNVGTVNLDVNGNTLTCTFVQSGGATPDNFTITKQGAADTDSDGISDAYEIAYGLNRYADDAFGTGGDSDGVFNILEFAFGLNPNVNDGGPVIADVPGGALTQAGQPAVWYQTTINGTDFYVIYTRRKDYLEDGLVYNPQFSGDLVNWVNSSVTPTVIATVGEIELVRIKYPLFAAGQVARFFKIGVSSNH